MSYISPEYISQFISFQYGNSNWKYNRYGKQDIPKIQAEGAAKLWNILEDKNIALLADEVGMGKTYQALAIIITIWLQKPDAKILIYAPNENVANKWIKEYETFIRYHYKFTDDKIKSSINGNPLRKAIYCENQLELLQYVNQAWPSLYVCKTSSLSNFISKKITQDKLDSLGIHITRNFENQTDKNVEEELKAKWMYRFAKKSNDFIYNRLAKEGHSPFDLIVFDEAHYLRNAHSNTNRSLVANAFFAKRDIHNYDGQKDEIKFLSQKTLLMTATPNHSNSKNIESIVSIFNNSFKGKAPSDILEQICVRRFRRLNGKTKHQYRQEEADEVTMGSLQEKLFFALYQRSLVKYKAAQYKKQKDKSKNQNPYRLLFGYLEGFEFLPNRNNDNPKLSQVQTNSDNFYSGDDKELIRDLADVHYKVYNEYPIHPKYINTTNKLSPTIGGDLLIEKKLVFVRRIPSILELSRRVIESYDAQFAKILIDSKGLEDVSTDFNYWSENKLRKYFAGIVKGTDNDIEDVDNEFINDNATKDTFNIYSKYYSLFTPRKDVVKYKTTDCSNFRIRFTKDFSLFSVFMHPGSDYFDKPYVFTKYLYQGDKRNYTVTAIEKRIEPLDRKKKERLNIQFPKDLQYKTGHKITLPTIFTIWINAIKYSDDKLQLDALKVYKSLTVIEKEAFSNYLSKGLLFASSFLILFYANYKYITKKGNLKNEDLYLEFCKTVERDMINKGLATLIAKAINTFQLFYRKELNITPDNLLTEKWSFLYNVSPVYPVCAETNRASILKAFNTPFYPNVLISTSVLQEGVDLHYHCNEVIHYGLAWTQGDNEQRVGRVDRLNGKMEIQLKESDNATLPIHYPYLKNTLDQDQTTRFILRKKEAEKLIDQFDQIEQSSEINFLEHVDENTLKSCLSKPIDNTSDVKDPFPVVYSNDFTKVITELIVVENSQSSKTILNPILQVLEEHFKSEFYIYDSKLNMPDNRVFAIKHIRNNGRDQPIIAELNYYEPGLHVLNVPVYYLRIKTPIYHRGYLYDDLSKFGKQKDIYASNPLLKICYDNNRKDEFKYYVCVDLPVFYIKNKQLNISDGEVINVVNDLINFSDDLENIFTQKNILNEKVINGNITKWNKFTKRLSKDRGINIDNKWKSLGIYIYREKQHTENFDSFNHIYDFNAKEVFVKYYRNYGSHFRCVGFYKNDALQEEIKLYNYIFDNENIKLMK